MKKWIALILTLVMVVGACPLVLAANAGDACVVLGADLTDEQIADVYKHFTLTRGELPELKVTIDEERARLGEYISADKIGSYSLSCVFIRVLPEGEGVSIDTHNIDWCTADMYKNALITADSSIATAAGRFGIEVLQIAQGAIRLVGYDYGFIGGCASFSPYKTTDTIFFCGDVSLHPNAESIRDFCIRHGYRTHSLGKDPLTDVGTLFLI